MILLDTHIWIQWIMNGEEAIPSSIARAIQEAAEAQWDSRQFMINLLPNSS